MSFFKSTRNLVAVGILGAIGAVLMILNFNIPTIMPSFIKLDFSESTVRMILLFLLLIFASIVLNTKMKINTNNDVATAPI